MSTAWLLFVMSLPTQSATGRMRIWRSIKNLGCASLRDGAYLLPATPQNETAFRDLAEECVSEGGTGWVLSVVGADARDSESFGLLFDRSDDYAALMKSWKDATPSIRTMPASDLARLRKKLRKDYEALRAIDFFPSDASTTAELAWRELNARIDRVLSPDEPRDVAGQVRRLDPREYQNRVWATRQRIWVDRVASSWLIRRFIDSQARFLWLATPAECPPDALSFDFDGATFTHVGDRVTFETLLASFRLDTDAALARLGALVNGLDVGGAPVPEAAGFEAILAGASERSPNDDALLDAMSPVLDSLYLHFTRDSQGDKRPSAVT